MNERMSIDRKFFADLVKEVGLNASHLEALGERQHWEIVVGCDMLEQMIEIQHRFERLAVIGDDEYRGFYIEVPRPTPEEWGNAEELIASGEYDSRRRSWRIGLHSTRWRHGGSMSPRPDTVIPGRFVLRTGNVPCSSSRTVLLVLMGPPMMRGAGIFSHVSSTICNG